MDDADLDLAVDGILWCAFGTSGQRCTAASRVIVHRAASTTSSSRSSSRRAEKMRLGPGWEDEHGPRPGDQPGARSRRSTRTRRSARTRARRCSPAARSRPSNGLDDGFFYRPTIFGDVEPGMRIAQEEIFGPTTALIPVDVVRRGDPRRQRRPASASRRRSSRATSTAPSRAMRDLQTGITYVNAGTIGAEVHLPFGGTKEHRQRPPRSGPGRARRLHRVEVDLRRLLGHAAARADRQRVDRGTDPCGSVAYVVYSRASARCSSIWSTTTKLTAPPIFRRSSSHRPTSVGSATPTSRRPSARYEIGIAS